VREPVLVLDEYLRIIVASRSSYLTFDTAKIFRSAGFPIVERSDGCSAIEPAAHYANRSTGAHWRWASTISLNEPHFSGADVFWISYDRIFTKDDIDENQGLGGWFVDIAFLPDTKVDIFLDL
jgi:hypothetical protein